VAFGVSAIGKVADGYAQNGKALAAYAEAIGAGRFATCRGLVLSQQDRLRPEVIRRIMGRFRVEKTPVKVAERLAQETGETFEPVARRTGP
jgi:coproporphyrinogen III oxidase-like Fe-S oxidoreductase